MAADDTIPVRCPGCQAGFDVPVGLAGKTIRCTSCKTQLPVPTPGARGAAAGGKSKSVGDLLPTAKSAPKGPSAGPPGKSAAGLLPKGKPVRRRDDDDDEDDDDEDDRPARGRKKKASSGGGSALPLIIGAVVLLVLAGGGAGAYFVFKEKKPETASSGSSSTPTSSPSGGPPAGMMRPPGGGGPPPGMAMPGGPPGAPTPGADGDLPPRGAGGGGDWQVVQGDGFSVEMPGGATKRENMTIPGAGIMQMLGAEVPGGKGGFIAISMTLPPEARMLQPKAMLGMIVDGMEKGAKGGGPNGPGSFGGKGPQSFGGKGNPFGGLGDKARITGKRETQVDGHPAVDLDITPDKGSGVGFGKIVAADVKIIILIAAHESDAGFTSQAQRFLGSLKISAGPVAVATPGGPPGMTYPVPGGPPPGMTFPTPGGPPPGMTFPMPGGPPPGTLPNRPPGGPPPGMTFPMPGGPPPGMVAPTPGGPPPGMTFPTPGGPPPGMTFPTPGAPPMFPPPGEGTPGGGTPGFGGGGTGTVVPALAAQVTPFYALAIDAEKGEAFAVSMQPVSNTRAEYTLRRYTYPEFTAKGVWKVPHLATRAALDPVNGKLYLATASALTPAVFAQRNDRAAASGDVEVFDLAAIRSGKAESGTALKAQAVISVGAYVRGLDVSPDGKTLTVLVARQTGLKQGKSTLRQFDTGDRKMVREKDLSSPAWDLSRSADGGTLLVTEYPGSATQSALAVDPATLAVKATGLPAGVICDVAVGPEGKLVAGVGAAGKDPGKLYLIDPASGAPQEIPTVGVRACQNGYVRFTPDGKKLLVASHAMGPSGMVPGLDVYEVSDAATAGGYKKVATIRHAGGVIVGGNFHIAPDGKRVVFQTGAVLDTEKLTEHVGGPEPPGLGGGNPGGFGGEGGPPGAPPGAGPPPGFGPMGPMGPGGPPAAGRSGGGPPGGPGVRPPGFGPMGPGGAPMPPPAVPPPGFGPNPNGGAPGAPPAVPPPGVGPNPNGGAPVPPGGVPGGPPGGVRPPPGVGPNPNGGMPPAPPGGGAVPPPVVP